MSEDRPPWVVHKAWDDVHKCVVYRTLDKRGNIFNAKLTETDTPNLFAAFEKSRDGKWIKTGYRYEKDKIYYECKSYIVHCGSHSSGEQSEGVNEICFTERNKYWMIVCPQTQTYLDKDTTYLDKDIFCSLADEHLKIGDLIAIRWTRQKKNVPVAFADVYQKVKGDDFFRKCDDWNLGKKTDWTPLVQNGSNPEHSNVYKGIDGIHRYFINKRAFWCFKARTSCSDEKEWVFKDVFGYKIVISDTVYDPNKIHVIGTCVDAEKLENDEFCPVYQGAHIGTDRSKQFTRRYVQQRAESWGGGFTERGKELQEKKNAIRKIHRSLTPTDKEKTLKGLEMYEQIIADKADLYKVVTFQQGHHRYVSPPKETNYTIYESGEEWGDFLIAKSDTDSGVEKWTLTFKPINAEVITLLNPSAGDTDYNETDYALLDNYDFQFSDDTGRALKTEELAKLVENLIQFMVGMSVEKFIKPGGVNTKAVFYVEVVGNNTDGIRPKEFVNMLQPACLYEVAEITEGGVARTFRQFNYFVEYFINNLDRAVLNDDFAKEGDIGALKRVGRPKGERVKAQQVKRNHAYVFHLLTRMYEPYYTPTDTEEEMFAGALHAKEALAGAFDAHYYLTKLNQFDDSPAHAAGTGAHAAGTGAHAAGTGAHAADTGAHAAGTGAHAAGTGAHAAGTGAHAAGTGAHAADTGAHAAGGGARSTGSNENEKQAFLTKAMVQFKRCQDFYFEELGKLKPLQEHRFRLYNTTRNVQVGYQLQITNKQIAQLYYRHVLDVTFWNNELLKYGFQPLFERPPYPLTTTMAGFIDKSLQLDISLKV